MSVNKNEIKKVVLAYSGGLDTSIIIPWLKENYNDPEIIAVSGNVGQADELEGLEEKALKTGASKLIVADLVDEMCDDVIVPSLKMGAKYEKYLLGTAFARPIIGKKLAEIALAEGADAVVHGCTGKGNDQVRFELSRTRKQAAAREGGFRFLRCMHVCHQRLPAFPDGRKPRSFRLYNRYLYCFFRIFRVLCCGSRSLQNFLMKLICLGPLK